MLLVVVLLKWENYGCGLTFRKTEPSHQGDHEAAVPKANSITAFVLCLCSQADHVSPLSAGGPIRIVHTEDRSKTCTKGSP